MSKNTIECLFAIRNLRKKNEALSRNTTEGGKSLARSHTAEKARFGQFPAKTTISRDSTKEKVNRSIDHSLLRSGDKSPTPGSRNANRAQTLINKSLNFSVDEENKIDNSFATSVNRTSTNSKKSSYVQNRSSKPEQNLISTVYSVKKQSFLNISPIGRGKFENFLRNLEVKCD